MQNIITRRDKVAKLREKYPEGTKIRLLSMDDPQSPPVNTFGIITMVDDAENIHVAWKNGSSLSVIEGVDRFVIVREKNGT